VSALWIILFVASVFGGVLSTINPSNGTS